MRSAAVVLNVSGAEIVRVAERQVLLVGETGKSTYGIPCTEGPSQPEFLFEDCTQPEIELNRGGLYIFHQERRLQVKIFTDIKTVPGHAVAVCCQFALGSSDVIKEFYFGRVDLGQGGTDIPLFAI